MTRKGQSSATGKHAAWRGRQKAAAQALDPSRNSTLRSIYYGSKCYKTASDRRPHKGGKVHW